jgi:hypothetical protein
MIATRQRLGNGLQGPLDLFTVPWEGGIHDGNLGANRDL